MVNIVPMQKRKVAAESGDSVVLRGMTNLGGGTRCDRMLKHQKVKNEVEMGCQERKEERRIILSQAFVPLA